MLYKKECHEFFRQNLGLVSLSDTEKTWQAAIECVRKDFNKNRHEIIEIGGLRHVAVKQPFIDSMEEKT
jgi:hypothetical protein